MALRKTESAVETARQAEHAGRPVLVLRFNETMTDWNVNGAAPKAVNQGINDVETNTSYRLEGMTVERDHTTFGKRMAFYVTFRK